MSPDDAGSIQPFVLACPHCETGMRGRLHAGRARGQPSLLSEDFDLVDGRGDPDDPAVTVATDLPVHVSLRLGRAGDVMLTPFIHLASSLCNDAAGELMGRIGSVRVFREEQYPALRRAALAFARGDGPAVTRALTDEAADTTEFATQFAPTAQIGWAFMLAYAPAEDAALIEAARTEKADVFGNAVEANPAAVIELLQEMQTRWFTEHTNRVLDSALTLLGDIEPLICGLAAERLENAAGLGDYRVMRDDFDVLKGRYQDIFELGSRSLAFMSRVANIGRRATAADHVNGKRLSLSEAIRLKAVEREPWLADFPVAAQLYSAVKRHTRNEIGHRSVRYDFERGVLVYDDGAEQNYLLFLVDYLQVVRLSHYLLEVVFTFRRAMEPLGITTVGHARS